MLFGGWERINGKFAVWSAAQFFIWMWVFVNLSGMKSPVKVETTRLDIRLKVIVLCLSFFSSLHILWKLCLAGYAFLFSSDESESWHCKYWFSGWPNGLLEFFHWFLSPRTPASKLYISEYNLKRLSGFAGTCSPEWHLLSVFHLKLHMISIVKFCVLYVSKLAIFSSDFMCIISFL